MCMRRAPSARRTPISPRRSSTEITITLVIPTPPTTRATAPSASSRLRSAVVGGGPGLEGVRRPRHVHLVRRLGVDRTGEHVAHVLDAVGRRAHEQRRRRRGGVEQRRRRPGTRSAPPSRAPGRAAAGSRMPITANHSPPSHTRGPSSRSRDAESARGVGAEHDGRQALGRGVEEPAVGELRRWSRRACSRSAATTRMPPVTASSMRSVRRTVGVDRRDPGGWP